MHSVTGFVSELVRAANEPDRLTVSEIQHLLFRGITTISDLREQVGIPGSGTNRDMIITLNGAAAGADKLSADEASAALSETADLIRTLWIVVDSGIELRLIPSREETET
ncbi:hypothetical protein FHT79_001777 [Rhizobium sp. BK212]|uniref:hypothetical protein n=1 Tax=Rhizobium sp. BK212 TaxID=2587074 RepID=UPI00161B7D0D|nr:hypothetical protein [Rhizobium sp. BK212]MBB4214622.1 hypothetical protein [Rhizobium sp. BK212]